jgi:phage terminase large subunit
MEIECSNGNKMIAHGLDNIEKVKSIQEPTDIWVEEATEVSKQEVTQLNLRLRTKKAKHNQVCLSFNPISSEHWIYDSFIVKKEFEAEIVKTTYHDNRFLPDAYREQLEALKQTDENYYKVYCLGEWGGKIKGVIYQNWNMCDHFPQFSEYIYGLDFGFNDPTALVKIGVVDKKHAYVQQLIFRSGLTNADLITELRKLNIGKSVIYADNARPEAIEEIYRAGFNIKPADKGKDSVQNGIDFVKSLTLNIMDDSPDLIKELNNYKWAEDKNGNLIESKPVDFFNHSLDAMRYALHTHVGRPNGAFRISVI